MSILDTKQPVGDDERSASAAGGSPGRRAEARTSVHRLYGVGRNPFGTGDFAAGSPAPGPGAAALAMFMEDFKDRVLPFDTAAAVAYAEILAARRRAGRPTSTLDLMVAPAARVPGASIVAREGGDGCGVTVIDPWAAP
jgi:hypothetical protein